MRNRCQLESSAVWIALSQEQRTMPVQRVRICVTQSCCHYLQVLEVTRELATSPDGMYGTCMHSPLF